ncbi:hypothetical protein [Anaerocolumna aminovalerica]|jgi:glucan phosphoethanolaminetransferase (alkaline phosphatase superfamily)|uniref:hypothetical protein n=1 Tax=Anaerocolumna aminovalerica TaxID=1527 RepID=UPI001C0EAE0B|nr:hypothetical protein [Anaerocolumna aminovalerica]MBU5333287.1 hypothetical protein [Anaerocolumna aminovalerica]
MEDLLTLLNVLQAKRKFFLPFLAFCWIFITCFLFPQPFINKGNSSILFNYGDSLRKLHIPISYPIIASPYCRTIGTAQLAFGWRNIQVDPFWAELID